jgi:hypothetical protein
MQTMFRGLRLGIVGILVLVMGLATFGSVAHAASVVTNGGFETGNFTGWTVYNQPGGSGNWYVYSGTTSPVSSFTIPAPPEGKYAATSDQGGQGSHILYQNIDIPAGLTCTLSMYIYYENRNGSFYSPPTLDFTASPNQQYRIDLMTTGSPITSVAPADVLQTIFATTPSSPLIMAPTFSSTNVSAYGGTTIRLRFAEVDDQFFFQGNTDAVSLTCTGSYVPYAAANNQANPNPNYYVSAVFRWNNQFKQLRGDLDYRDYGTPFFINAYGATGSSVAPGIGAPKSSYCSSYAPSRPYCALTVQALQCSGGVATAGGTYQVFTGAFAGTYSFTATITLNSPSTIQLTAQKPGGGVYVGPAVPVQANIQCP